MTSIATPPQEGYPKECAVDFSNVDDLVIESRNNIRSSVKRSESLGNLSAISNVSFGAVEIQEYPMVLGDNPSTSRGPSVELDWECMNKLTIDDLDQYESQKPPRREMNELAMPSQMRTKLLIENGHSMREILEITKQRDAVRQKAKSGKKLPKLLKFLGK